MSKWEGQQVSRNQSGGTGTGWSPAPPLPCSLTLEKSLLGFVSSFTREEDRDWPSVFTVWNSRRCDSDLKSKKCQINERIRVMIESAIGCPRQSPRKVELWSPLFTADSSGRRPEV